MKKIALATLAALTLGAYAAGRAAAAAWERGAPPAETAAAAAGREAVFLRAAFDATGARATGFEVHDWSTVNARFEGIAALERQAKAAAGAMGLTDLRLFAHNGRANRTAVWSGTFAGPALRGTATGTAEFASMVFPGVSPQTVCILRIYAHSAGARGFNGAYRTVWAAAKGVGGQAIQNATIFGKRMALLNRRERAAAVRKAFAAVRGREQQGMTYTYTTSVSGFAPASVPDLRSAGQSINLQVALHEDHYYGDTRVLVGSPILTLEY